VVYSGPLILAWSGRHRASRVALVAIFIGAVLFGGFYFGSQLGAHVFCLPALAAIWYAVPPRERRSALLATAAVVITWFVLAFNPPRQNAPSLGLMSPAGLRLLQEGIALGICAFLAIVGARRTAIAEQQLDEERHRSEALLENMLPKSIAERLKREPGPIADGYDAVTVLFADIVGFTPLSETMSPAELVKLLNQIFSEFDGLARRHGLEKIKTIGDAYMVVGGVPAARGDHARAVAAMAVDMRSAVTRLSEGKLQLRIGMHSGPAVAGVIGTAKYSYDLWGDTVNTASRMESHGAPGEIHVSEACRAALAGSYALRGRGVVDIKGKGPMQTWWLDDQPAAAASPSANDLRPRPTLK